MQKILPLLAAIISAVALIIGYVYQKDKEMEAEITKKRQQIYSDFINNITERLVLMDKIKRSPEAPRQDDPQFQYKYSQFVMNDPELSKNINEGKKINTFITLYGTDEAIEAYVNYLKEGWAQSKGLRKEAPDIGRLMQTWRKSIYPKTTISAEDINIIFWNDGEHFERAEAVARQKSAK